jgi:CheY-like chemotaxis protein
MRHTVLVVEDEVELCEIMCQALELSGYAVIGARDGKDALDKVDGIDSLCLVILDLLMPEMNGWEFVEQLRKRARFTAVPIIVHSSAAGPAPATVARVLKKPVPFDGLLAAVREYCRPAGVQASTCS